MKKTIIVLLWSFLIATLISCDESSAAPFDSCVDQCVNQTHHTEEFCRESACNLN